MYNPFTIMFWDQASETLARPTLEQLQLKRLQDTLQRVAQRVPFYQQRFTELGITPAEIKSLADVRRLPFTTGDDLRAIYPDGMLAVAPGFDGTKVLYGASSVSLLTLVSRTHTFPGSCPGLLLQRSRPRLLTAAAWSGLVPAP